MSETTALIAVLKRSFTKPYSTGQIIAAVTQGVLYLATVPLMDGYKKKEVLLAALTAVLNELGIQDGIINVLPSMIDNLVVLGKSDLFKRGCCCL